MDKRIKWLNDLDQALSTRMTTAERLVLLGTFYDIASLQGATAVLRSDSEPPKGGEWEYEYSSRSPFSPIDVEQS